jgi:N-methylhydantoinase A
MAQTTWMVGVDVGGTFTDAIAVASDGTIRVAKVPSTPADSSAGFEHALASLLAGEVAPGAVGLLCHGTTVATNALLTGHTARVVLVTTDGFRDVLAYRDGRRPAVYDLEPAKPRELVPRRDRLEAAERISHRGDVLTELTPAETERVCAEVAARRPEAIAVGFLFAYLNDEHEQVLGAALRRRFPGVPVTLSSEVAREFREYPRIATTVVNAGLRPVVGQYLLRAAERAGQLGVRAPLLVMQSNGGCVPGTRAGPEAHRLLVSGPTAGVTGAVALGARYGLGRLISLDMGGTSLDVCLVRDGTLPLTPVQLVDGNPVLCSSVEIATAGAGGGSIAYADRTGRLRIGPQSAGAVPGPAAYGLGGSDATVTDAHVVAGTLPADLELAGGLKLDAGAAREAVGRLADDLGLEIDRAATGIVAVAVAQVTATLRHVSVERGIDPREYTLVAFGGAGPLHAALLMRELGLKSVLIPAYPGLFAAAGLMAADLRIDESQTILRTLDRSAAAELSDWFRGAARRLRGRLRADGIPAARVRVLASVDCRFLGQGFDLAVQLPAMSATAITAVAGRFRDLHARTYGHADPAEPVELVTARVSAFGLLDRPEPARIPAGSRRPRSAAVLGPTMAVLPGNDGPREVPVYARDALRDRNRITGPAIVHQMDSTILVLDDQVADVDEQGSLWLSPQARR